jgi:hypothetical protein
LSITATAAASGNGEFRISVSDDGGFPQSSAGIDAFTADGTSGIYIWGADLRVTNDGVGIPAYQRVGAATAGSSTAAGTADYDSTGFPPYLRFDGTDDSMATAAIDFTATDKMSVFAGVRKLSDAARGILVELSATRATNNGAFTIDAPGASFATDKYVFASKGTVDAFAAATAASLTAPVTNVLTATCNIAGDAARLRANGTQVLEVLTDQGTGNYGNYALYIGRRGGTTLPYNGRLYSLIALGRTATAGQISDTETWVNGKTKAYV